MSDIRITGNIESHYFTIDIKCLRSRYYLGKRVILYYNQWVIFVVVNLKHFHNAKQIRWPNVRTNDKLYYLIHVYDLWASHSLMGSILILRSNKISLNIKIVLDNLLLSIGIVNTAVTLYTLLVCRPSDNLSDSDISREHQNLRLLQHHVQNSFRHIIILILTRVLYTGFVLSVDIRLYKRTTRRPWPPTGW